MKIQIIIYVAFIFTIEAISYGLVLVHDKILAGVIVMLFGLITGVCYLLLTDIYNNKNIDRL